MLQDCQYNILFEMFLRYSVLFRDVDRIRSIVFRMGTYVEITAMACIFLFYFKSNQ